MKSVETIPGIGETYRADTYQTVVLKGRNGAEAVAVTEDLVERTGVIAVFSIESAALALPVSMALGVDELDDLIRSLARARMTMKPCDCFECRSRAQDTSGAKDAN